MTRLKLLILGFVLGSLALAYWLFVNWFAYAMADFDCAGSVWTCEPDTVRRVAWRVGAAVAAWGILAWLMVREWKKD